MPSTTGSSFPSGLNGLENVRPLGGSTGAMLVRDPATGQLFVMKRGNSPEHIQEEAIADSVYEAMGVPVPKHRMYVDDNGRPVKLSEYIEGRQLSELSESERKEVYQQMQQHFTIDAIVGNWDVLGAGLDNVIVRDGIAYRVDNGGSMRFRAQGAEKVGDQWNEYPTELYTMRDAKFLAGNAYSSMSFKDVVDQIRNLPDDRVAQAIALVPDPQQRRILERRFEEARRTAEIGEMLMKDSFKEAYADDFTRHSLGIRNAGIVDKMPRQMSNNPVEVDPYNLFDGSLNTPEAKSYTILKDENGVEFDNLRTRPVPGGGYANAPPSLIGNLADYMKENGMDFKFPSAYLSAQGCNSWSYTSSAMKAWLAGQRTIDPEETFYWGTSLQTSLSNLQAIVQNGKYERYSQSMTAFHAFNYELLRTTDLPNINRDRQEIVLVRTESKSVMNMYGLIEGDRGVTMKRGAAESYSGYLPIEICGTEYTVQSVPLHRIIATYLYEAKPRSGGTSLYTDRENEFVAMADGIPFDYVAKKDVLNRMRSMVESN
ncbi:MAG TPA: hypothetical protein IGS37_03850 [Synechococcales cyanobacterium M55_K2018_004]|nr:hypothetical protein [Synechococcales cyanobacterium M55_K2018_004]